MYWLRVILFPLGCRFISTLNSVVEAITYFTPSVPNYVIWVVRYEIATGYNFDDLLEAGGLYLRLYRSFTRSAVGIIPTSNPRAMSTIVLSRSISVTPFDEGEGSLAGWAVCDLVGALWGEAKRFLIGLFHRSFPLFELINEAE